MDGSLYHIINKPDAVAAGVAKEHVFICKPLLKPLFPEHLLVLQPCFFFQIQHSSIGFKTSKNFIGVSFLG